MSDYGFARCDGEFEVIGEDLNMSTMGIVQMTQAEPWKAPRVEAQRRVHLPVSCGCYMNTVVILRASGLWLSVAPILSESPWPLCFNMETLP